MKKSNRSIHFSEEKVSKKIPYCGTEILPEDMKAVAQYVLRIEKKVCHEWCDQLNMYDYIRSHIDYHYRMNKLQELEEYRLRCFKKNRRKKVIKMMSYVFSDSIRQANEFYTFEAVKLLSLSFDPLAKLKDIQMDNLELVLEVVEEIDLILKELIAISYFLRKALEAFKNSYQLLHDTFWAFEDKEFQRIANESHSFRGSCLRRLIEHPEIFKALATALYVHSLIEKEMTKAMSHFGFERRDLDWDSDSHSIPDEDPNENKEQLRGILEKMIRIKCVLEYLQPSIVETGKSTKFWDQLSLNTTNYTDMENLRTKIHQLYQNPVLTKDDFIVSNLKDYEDEFDFYDEEDFDSPASDVTSLWLMMLHTAFIMTNYYGLYPLAFQLKEDLSTKTSTMVYCWIISLTPLTATLVIPYYGWLSKQSYKLVYLQSIFLLILGNLFYFISTLPSVRSLPLLIIGRILIGAGGTRIASKKFLVLLVNEPFRQRYSTYFITLANAGKAIGPGIVALCVLIDAKIESSKSDSSLISLIFGIFWVIFFVVTLFFFRSQNRLINKKLQKLDKQADIEAQIYKEVIKMKKKDVKELYVGRGMSPGTSRLSELKINSNPSFQMPNTERERLEDNISPVSRDKVFDGISKFN